MTPKEAAAKLDGSQYRNEGSRELFAEMRAAGLVAVFGASDDLMEFRGAIDEEIGAWNGTTVHLTKEGLTKNDCDSEECPHYAKLVARSTPLEAKWDDGGFSWRYETAIPCERFIVREDDDPYCEGIVFALSDVPAA